MNDDSTTKKTTEADATPATDWSRFDAMTEAERHRAAIDDPDAQPLAEADFDRMPRTPQVKVIRRALGLTQDASAYRSERCATGNKAASLRIKPPAPISPSSPAIPTPCAARSRWLSAPKRRQAATRQPSPRNRQKPDRLSRSVGPRSTPVPPACGRTDPYGRLATARRGSHARP
jgi:hypothetical protein